MRSEQVDRVLELHGEIFRHDRVKRCRRFDRRDVLAEAIRDYVRDPDQIDLSYEEAAKYDVILVESDDGGFDFFGEYLGDPSVQVRVSDWTRLIPDRDENGDESTS